MTKVTIEQTRGGWQTYIRLHAVSRMLEDPYFRISRPGSSGSLGPDGWKNTQRLNEAAQYLDRDDLLLEMEPNLVNYLEPGQAIELHIAELNLRERILPPELLSPTDGEAMEPESIERIPFTRGRRLARDTGQPTKKEDPTSSGGPDRAESGDRGVAPTGAATELISTSPLAPGGKPETVAPPPPQGAPARMRARLTGALLVLIGILIGAAGKYAVDKWTADSGLGATRPIVDVASEEERGQLQTEAFAPLSTDLNRIEAASPNGVSPDTVADALNVDRARTFYAQGGREALAGRKPEAVYWYKQAARMCPADALFFLGDAYFNGDGAPRDIRTGFQLMRCSAALGSPKAKEYLPSLLRSGNLPLAPRGQSEPF